MVGGLRWGFVATTKSHGSIQPRWENGFPNPFMRRQRKAGVLLPKQKQHCPPFRICQSLGLVMSGHQIIFISRVSREFGEVAEEVRDLIGAFKQTSRPIKGLRIVLLVAF